MKIFSISIVKNECDIIESFVRYNSNIFDGMLIVDHSSTDNTKVILDNLKLEGYNLLIYSKEEIPNNNGDTLTQYMHQLYRDEKPDIIIPLDADEFLICDGSNPREYLEKLPLDNVYRIHWKNYIYMEEDSEFIPSRMHFHRNLNFDPFLKVIIPCNFMDNYDISLTQGNHDVIGIPPEKRVINEDLFVAHYPIRSKEHLYSKICVSTLNAMCRPHRAPNISFHWFDLYEKIKNNEEIDLTYVSLTYSLDEEYLNKLLTSNEDPAIFNPVDISFCKNIDIKYSNLSKINYLDNILNNVEIIVNNYLKLRDK